MAAKSDIVPLPRTRDWASGLPPDRWAAFAHFHYPVAYHINWSEELVDRARKIVYQDQWGPLDLESRSAHLVSWDVDEAVFVGGIAMVEAGAALDCVLQLVNHVLGLRIPKKRVWWTRAPSEVRSRIAKLTDAKAPPLLAALTRVYDSIGYEAFERYRNWVMHRGAPRVEYGVDLGKPVAFPIEPPPDDPPGHRDFVLRNSLSQRVMNSTSVTSSTFVPPAQARYRGSPEPATEDFVSGPLRIERRARDAILADFVVMQGDLFQDAEAYRATNQMSMDDGRLSMDEDELGRYTPLVFVEAVAQVVSSFAKVAVTETIDVPLVELLRSRA